MMRSLRNRLPASRGGRREPNWKENDEILNAAGVNDVSTLQKLSSQGVDVTAASNWNESTTLHIAAQRGSWRVVQMLLEYNAKPNATNNVKSTPLHYASSGGYQQVVKLLVDAGALIRCKDKDNKTPLHLAANRGHCEVVKTLVDAGATVDAKDKHGSTPLANAIKNSHRTVVNYLISEAKADIGKISKDLLYSYKSNGRDQQKCSYGQKSSSPQPVTVTSTPSHLMSSSQQHQRYPQQQISQAHAQRTQQCQSYTSHDQPDHKATHRQHQQYYNLFLAQLNKQMQQQSQAQQQPKQSSRQSLHIEVEIQIPPIKNLLQDKKQTAQQQSSEAKKQHNTETASASATPQHTADQDKKSKHDETQLQRETRQQTEKLPQKTVLVQERIEQKQRKMVEETQELCIKEELYYANDHSRVYEIEREMMNASSDSMSDVTGNDETCSEVDIVTNDINSSGNTLSAQEVHQVTSGSQSSVHKEESSDSERSPTDVTSHHLSHHHPQQPLPHCAAQQSTNGIQPVNIQNTSPEDKQPEVQPLTSHSHQQLPFNYYPGYQPFYHQQDQSSTLPGHYVPTHQQPLPHHMYRHYTMPVVSYHHSPYAHYHQQEFQQHPQGYEHRSSSPAVLEHTAYKATPPNYNGYAVHSYEHQSSSPAVLEHTARTAATPQINATQCNIQPPPDGYAVHSYEHRSSSPAVLERTATPQINATQCNLQPPDGYAVHNYEHRSSSPAVLEHTAHTATPQISTAQYNIQPPDGYAVHNYEHRSSSPAVLEHTAHTATPQISTAQYNIQPPNGYAVHNYEHRSSSPVVLNQTVNPALRQISTTQYNLQPPSGYAVAHNNLVSSQNPSPVMSPSPVPLPSQSPVPLVVPVSSPVPSPVIVPSPAMSHTPQNVEQPQLANNNNNNLPTNPQQIDSQLQELMKQIEALKAQREAYEKASKQEEGNVVVIAPDNVSLKQSLDSPGTDVSDTTTTVSNSGTPDIIPMDNAHHSNAEVIPLSKNGHQSNSGNQLISNLFSSFQTPPQAGGNNVVMQVLVMQDNNIAFPTATTRLSIDYGEDNHNSLKAFATDIYSAIDVDTILPFMVKHGLLTSSEHQYFLNPYHTSNDKQNKLTCIAVTASEEGVEKFLLCLEETCHYEPHETLLKKIRDGTENI